MSDLALQALIKFAKIQKINFDFTGLQPFVIAASEKDEGVKTVLNKGSDIVLSTPFHLWSYEFSNSYAPSWSELGLSDITGDDMLFSPCVVVKEIFPGEYKFLVLYKSGDLLCVEIITKTHKNYDYTLNQTNEILEKINQQKSGVIAKRIREKFSHNSANKLFKCSNVIYISKSDREKTILGISTNPVQWSHIWSVRGHWRKLESDESIGKDRLGERLVKGYTWVNPFLKGEGQELIKLRKVS